MSSSPSLDNQPKGPSQEGDDPNLDEEFPIGPFALTGFIGRGGMGEVWEGRHRRHDIPVAVKVVTDAKATDERYLRRFNNEVASVAALNHPAIVTVLDYGHVPEEQTDSLFRPSTPYLAMEFAEAGSLERYAGELDWPAMRSMLLTILDGLGHAHARGVIHRDLKPSNILLTTDEEGELQPKISDFGLAFIPQRALSDDNPSNQNGGTPQYMAPEQFRGDWRDYGPWSDLYALGCLAWELATSCPPFGGKSIPTIRKHHLNDPLPDFKATVAVPEEFPRWLARLMQKDPARRFQTAADAAWGLMELDGPESLPEDADPAPQDAYFDRTSSVNETRQTLPPTLGSPALSQSFGRMPGGAQDGEEGPEPNIDPLPIEQPPLPGHWDQDVRPRFPTNLMGAGLRLYGLRELPVVDRHSEREKLWDALRAIHDGEGSQLVLLSGAAGTGKSRLARWLREYAYRVGAAHQMEATHNPSGGPSDGIASMISRYLGCTGLGPEQTRHRVKTWHDQQDIEEPYEWKSLAQLILPVDEERDNWIEFSGENERYAVIRRFFDRVSDQRPLVVHLDDLHWGYRSLQFLDYALSHPRSEELPTLFVGTVRGESLAERPLEAGLLGEIVDHDRVTEIEVDALPSEAHHLLVERLLHLDPALSHKVADRSGNNPLFAIQLVGDWVDRRLLEVGPRGFELSEELDQVLPDDLYEVWSGHLARLLKSRADTDRIALEGAAALGLEVRKDEWAAVCAQLEIDTPTDLLQDMVRQNLATRTDHGWSFAHSMLRETLERSARENDRWRDLCRLCARMLEDGELRVADRERDYRLARYYLEAGDDAQAVPPLLAAIKSRNHRADADAADFLLDELEGTFERLDIEASHPWRNQYRVRKGFIHVQRSEFEAAQQLFGSVLADDHGPQLSDIEVEARFGLGRCAHYKGDFERSLEVSQQTLDALDRDEEPVEYARILRSMAEVYLSTGKYAEARPLLNEAHELLEKRTPVEAAKLIYQNGVAALFNDELGEARRCFSEGLEVFESYGNHYGMARCLNGLGEVARLAEDLDLAADYYERASRSAALVEAPELADIEASRAQLAMDYGDYQKAFETLRALNRPDSANGPTYTQTICHALLICCEVALRKWERFETDFATLEAVLDKTSMVVPDIAEALILAVEQARQNDRRDIAERLARLAVDQFEALDNARKVDQLRESFPDL